MKTENCRRFVFLKIMIIVCFCLCGNHSFVVQAFAGKMNFSNEEEDFEKFVLLRSRLKENIKNKERIKINFSIAEYYYKANDLYDAGVAFSDYLTQDHQGIGAFLANVYLYKIASNKNDDQKLAALKKELFKEQFILLFDKFKVQEYLSYSFKNKYEIRYFVDKIEVYLNGELFEQISP